MHRGLDIYVKTARNYLTCFLDSVTNELDRTLRQVEDTTRPNRVTYHGQFSLVFLQLSSKAKGLISTIKNIAVSTSQQAVENDSTYNSLERFAIFFKVLASSTPQEFQNFSKLLKNASTESVLNSL